MDITFTCKCGQNIVIDEAGAGITVDCPQCGMPVFVPSNTPKARDIPVRVETPLAKLMAKQAQTPNTPRSATPVFTPHKPEDIHPSIRASLACLLILAGVCLFGMIMIQQNLFIAMGLLYVAAPFATGETLCAIYGMCVGHVKHGLLLLGVMSLMIGLSYWTFLRMMFGQLPQFPH